jgi:uncharacterized membrane protein
VLIATALALAAAVIHAAWNLSVKQGGDRFIALWGQFTIAGGLGLVTVLAFGDFPARGWIWAAISGCIHLPYCWFLARAYDHGDFSLVYPMARGTGALLAAIGGLVLLGDHISPVGIGAIAVVAGGLLLLGGRARGPALYSALAVAATIGGYSISDAKGIRSTDTPLYALASFVGAAVTISTFGLLTHRGPAMAAGMKQNWQRYTLMGLASALTYGMVQLAFQRAAVGYVTALRESSVVLAAFAGKHMLGETGGRRRVVAACIVLAGLILLVIAR